MNQKTIGIVITFAILFLMGAIFVGVVASSTAERTVQTKITETVDFTAAKNGSGAINETYYFHLNKGCPYADGWRIDAGCAITNYGVKNSSGATLTSGTDYTFVPDGTTCSGYASGDLRFLGTALMNATVVNTTTIEYSYCQDGYVYGWSGTILKMVPGFLALGLLIAIAFLIFYVLRAEGVKIDL